MRARKSGCHIHRGAIAALLAAALTPCAMAQSAWDGMAPSPVWGNFQYGLTWLQAKDQGEREIASDSEYWRLEMGMRIQKDWMVGVGFQGISLASYDKMDQVYGTVLWVPDRGPWVYQAGLGRTRYTVNFNGDDFDEKYTGLGAHLGVGWDWTPKSIGDVHLGARLTYEYAWLGERDNGASLDHSRVNLAFSMSFY